MVKAFLFICTPVRALYQFPPLCSSVAGHFVARFLHFCCRWRKNRAPASSSGLRPPFWGLLFDTPTRDAVTGKSRGFARSGALGLPGDREGRIIKKLADFRAGKGAKV